MRSTPPRASTRSSAMSKRRYLKLVLPKLATRIFMMHSVESRLCDPPLNAQLPSEERIQHRFFRSRNHVSADELSIGAGCLSSGIDRCAHRADIASDKRRHVGAANLNLTREGDVRRLAHGVGRRDGRDQALGLDQTQGFMVAVVSRIA